MKSLFKKINALGLIALFVAGGMALAFTPTLPELNNEHDVWGRTPTGWVPAAPDAQCDPGLDPCLMLYPKGQNPNIDPEGGAPYGSQKGFVRID